MNDELSPISKGIVHVIGLASVVFSIWSTVIAFIGGRMPVIGWETDGGIGLGLLWLFIVDPIVITVFRYVAVILSLPFSLGRMSRDR